jgi:uncharacterized phage protein gp47/JayE
MADWGVNEKGFKRKPRNEIVNDMIKTAENLFGSDINTDDRNPLIKILKIVGYVVSLKWYAMESLYNSRWIGTASDESLNNIAQYIGIKRRPAVKATGEVEFSGDEGVEIPKGFLVKTDESKPERFETIESGIIDGSNLLLLQIKAVEAGIDGNVPKNTITEIVNPISGLDSVINPETTKNGLEQETDYELRERYKESVEKPGGPTINSIRAALLDIDGVRAALVIENDSNSIQGGIPAKSFESIVLGGIDEDIGNTILDRKAGGIEAYGENVIILEDYAGFEKDIGFTRAIEVDFYCSITIITDSDFPDDGNKQIKDEIINYVGGYNSDEELQFGTGLNENIFWSKIIDAIHNVNGIVEVEKLLMGKNYWDGITGIGSEIALGIKEVGETDINFIEIGEVILGGSSSVGRIESGVVTETPIA